MGGYIRLDKDQAADKRLYDLADRLAQTWAVTAVNGHAGHDLSSNDNRHALRNALLGGLVTLWVYADTHIRSDDSLRVTLTGLAPIVGLPVDMLQALPETWLRVREDGYVELPGYCRKNHIRARDLRRQDIDAKRAHELDLNAERQRRHREKKKQRPVTEKGERYSNGVTGHTGTGPGPLDPTRDRDPGASLAAGLGAAAPRADFETDFRQRFGADPPIKAAGTRTARPAARKP